MVDGGRGDECHEDGFAGDGAALANRSSTRATTRLNTPRTLLAWGGGEEYWRMAVESQEKESGSIKVAPGPRG